MKAGGRTAISIPKITSQAPTHITPWSSWTTTKRNRQILGFHVAETTPTVVLTRALFLQREGGDPARTAMIRTGRSRGVPEVQTPHGQIVRPGPFLLVVVRPHCTDGRRNWLRWLAHRCARDMHFAITKASKGGAVLVARAALCSSLGLSMRVVEQAQWGLCGGGVVGAQGLSEGLAFVQCFVASGSRGCASGAGVSAGAGPPGRDIAACVLPEHGAGVEYRLPRPAVLPHGPAEIHADAHSVRTR